MLADAAGIDDFALLSKDFGKERGLNPIQTEEHAQALAKLHSKLTTRVQSKKKEDDEEVIQFALNDRPRVILFEAKVNKKNHKSLVQQSVKRYAFLLNDVLLLTSGQQSSSTKIVSFSSEKLQLHQVFPLENMSIRDCSLTNPLEDPTAFEICVPGEAPYQLFAESEADKRIWLEELELAIFCLKIEKGDLPFGWQHQVVQGTIHSAAVKGDIETLKKHVESIYGQSLEVFDESGMTPFHWACLFGHLEIVQYLIESGCEVDQLNHGLNSPLLLAAGRGHADIVFYLIDNDADVHLRNMKDLNCLFMAVLFGHSTPQLFDMISTLKARGLDLNKMDSAGATALHECAAKNISRPIQCLVDCGVDVNIRHGRNGLNPLQISCSIPNPDPETVRTLLEKGAHPNWRDTSMRTAFQLVLAGHENKTSGGNTTNPGTNLDSSEEAEHQRRIETLDAVADFVQCCLPVLMELVKKGCRYTKESVAHLRPSFQEAIESSKKVWLDLKQPEEFPAFIKFKDVFSSLNEPEWTSDKASGRCLLCVDKFTYSNRRHHCRSCGILCCDDCSSKRLTLKLEKLSKSDYNGERVCDGCFNRFLYDFYVWDIAQKKAIKQHEKTMELMNKEKEEEFNQLRSASPTPQGSLFSKSSSNSESSNRLKNTNNGVNGATQAAREAGEQLAIRGEKLDNTLLKTEEMNRAASDFHKMSKQLLKQQQSKSFLS